MNLIIVKKNIIVLALLLLIILIIGCVESLTDSQQVTTPTIEVIKPKTGDTVHVGMNEISYQATAGTEGQGIYYFDVFINGVFKTKYLPNIDGTNPKIYLDIDSTLLGTKIKYHIVVYNYLGKYKLSSVQENIYVKDSTPNAPANLIIFKSSDTSVIFLWEDNSHNEKGFELWREGGSTANYQLIKTLPEKTITANDEGISTQVEYFYKIRAFNDSGPSDFSNEVSTSSLPDGPWGFYIEAIGASSVILKWNDFVTNEIGFKIERREPYNNIWSVIFITPPNQTEYEDKTVSASKTLIYRISYLTSKPIRSYSNELTIVTHYTDENGPTNLVATSSWGVFVKVEWKTNTQFGKSTIIERKEGASGKFIEIGTVTPDVLEYDDVNVTIGKTYFYRVRQTLGSRIYTPYSNTSYPVTIF